MTGEVVFDHDRMSRIGLAEAVFCAGKSTDQITGILNDHDASEKPLLLTRLEDAQVAALPELLRAKLDYDSVSRTAFFGAVAQPVGASMVAVVTAGSSDMPVAREVERTLRFTGKPASLFADIGVAGLWRVMDRVAELRAFPIVIVAAGMDAALVSVLGGLVPGAIIVVPTSVGYGASRHGETALAASLASCAPGVSVVNIDNGYGAACAALRILRAIDQTRGGD
ncbi:MAG: nickel pincer cofactor biosynthesis protein LarB [Alphaproteobacteria bacterium]